MKKKRRKARPLSAADRASLSASLMPFLQTTMLANILSSHIKKGSHIEIVIHPPKQDKGKKEPARYSCGGPDVGKA